VNLFWLISAVLIAISGLGVLFWWLPILRQNQESSNSNTGGVLAILAGRRGPILVGSVSVILIAIALSLSWNRADTTAFPPNEESQKSKVSPEHAKAIEELAARLKQNPSDGNGWAMLARTYAITGRYTEAVEAYEKAENLMQGNAVLLVDYADVLAMVSGKNMQGKPLDLIRKALEIDPDNIKALALLGTAEFQAGNFSLAEQLWSKLLPKLPPDSQFAKQVSAGIADAHARASEGAAPRNTAENNIQQFSKSSKISGVVRLEKRFAGKVEPTDTVYIFAKALNGPPMPLAVMKAQASELPLRFVLDDSFAMMPSMKLSDHDNVTISAKISKSGSADQQSGDLKGELSPVKLGAENVELVINRIVP